MANPNLEYVITAAGTKTFLTTLGQPLITYDESILLTSDTASYNFVGGGVTATTIGNDVTVTIPAGVSTALVSAHIFVGNAANIATDRQVSGDLSLTNLGVWTVQRINTANLGTTTATNANILVADGSAWQSVAMSGDATLANTGAITLATVNGNVGTFGSASQVGTFTVNGKGLITAAGNTSIQIAESQVTGLVTDLANKWAQGGNAFGAVGVLGTTDNNAISILANNIQQAYISPLQLLWLGTNSTTTRPYGYTDGQTLIVGNATGTDTNTPNFVGAQNTAGTTDFIAVFAGANYSIAGTEKRVARMNIVLDGASNSGLISWNTMVAGTSTEKMRLSSDGILMVGATAAVLSGDIGTFRKDQNSPTWLTITNATSGTGGRAGFLASASSTGSPNISMQAISAGFTTSGMRVANTGVVQSTLTGGLNVGTNNASSLMFWTNDAERMEINSSGYIGIGTTAVTNQPITTSFTANTNVISRFINPSTGTAGVSSIGVQNSAAIAQLSIHSTGYTTNGLLVAGITRLNAPGAAGMLYSTSTAAAPHIFSVGGITAASERFRINDASITGGADQSSAFTFTISNASTNSAAQTQIIASNGTYGSFLQILGTNFPTSGLNQANLTKFNSTSPVGVLFQSNVASTTFWWSIGGIASTDEYMRLTTTGLSINKQADAISSLDVTQRTLGNAVQVLESIATNTDPNETVYQNRVATTDATVTTLHTFTVPATTTYQIEVNVIARRTGGTAGTAEDGAGYKIIGTYKNVAGTATIIGALSVVHSVEDQAGWDATLDTTGATVRVRVTGALDNSIVWHLTARVWSVAS